ncbi:Sec-independent protein translocase subunit TatA [Mycolicibacter sinensis]|uniref:Sec-independent protein translocase protein TatA n=1 Tax=Mycolicibacter sinensis (strain JDM601) TaxID=875328 RepID=A0A1A2EQC1_MYCSD|nr:Sec-independent protein translocase subunit TatA [Mycolicibacter sinensis]MDD7814416.1 Sec-independent protein translocase subunit TatA [Mycobacterium sp. CSUR Q5927]OBG04376.1 preprotein translocase subunit TatA [Mycolicibacter sinensis]OBG06714.1 preprotein translocase subunit TatA [Mycolicibacter sinensis]OBK83111.1 preprotein translocase subunit TatA [Mycolicibacter sinensis]
MNALGPSHLAILAVAVIILFGAKRLPDAARSLGKSLRIFKSEVRELQSEAKPDSTATPTTVQSERVDPPAAGGQSA